MRDDGEPEGRAGCVRVRPLRKGLQDVRTLSLRQRASDFDYEISVGFSFQFGSIFNNVVNNRFSGVGIGRFFRGRGGGG